MSEAKQHRRSPSETLWLHLLLHIGFSKPLLSEAHLREGARPFGKRSIERAADMIDGRLAFQESQWPTRPSNRIPGKAVASNIQLIEISILATSMYYLFGDDVYQELSMNQILQAYDLYTNARDFAGNISKQVSPDTAFWLARELVCHCASIPYCPTCRIRYYSSIDQKMKCACPFCKKVGFGDFNVTDH